MEIEAAVAQLLLADSDLADLIGSRLYPQDAPQAADLPLVLYVSSGPEQMRSLRGYLDTHTITIRLDCYGSRAGGYASSKAIAKRIREVLFSAERTVIGSGTVRLQGVFDGGGEDGLQEPLYSEEEGIDYVGVVVRLAYQAV